MAYVVAHELLTTLRYWPNRWGRATLAVAVALATERAATPQEWQVILDQIEFALQPVMRTVLEMPLRSVLPPEEPE